MRVLWISNTPSNYEPFKDGKNWGSGWISSLEKEVASKVTLAVAFKVRRPESGPVVRNSVAYYPIYDPFDSGRSSRVRKLFTGNSSQLSWFLSSLLSVIREFKPDVIEVFGSEHPYGMIASFTEVPVVLHIQGILKECLGRFLPEGMGLVRYFGSGGSFSGRVGKFYHWLNMRRRSADEEEVLKTVHYFFGRTEWDKGIVLSMNPSAEYFHLDEILRAPFYELAGTWSPSGNVVIVTTISEPPYKGMDVVLKAASILKNRYGMKFSWKVFGNVNVPFFEKFTGITAEECGVVPMGVASAENIASELTSASVYVHPSYVDNSPNSLCEAQMIGVPVVSSAVGGVPSLIEDGVDGILARPGDAEDFASRIESLLSGKIDAVSMSAAGVSRAASRHDRSGIVNNLLAYYAFMMR